MASTATKLDSNQNFKKERYTLSFEGTDTSIEITDSSLKSIGAYSVARFGTAGGANTGRCVLTIAPGASISSTAEIDGTFTVTREEIDPAGTLAAETFVLTIEE